MILSLQKDLRGSTFSAHRPPLADAARFALADLAGARLAVRADGRLTPFRRDAVDPTPRNPLQKSLRARWKTGEREPVTGTRSFRRSVAWFFNWMHRSPYLGTITGRSLDVPLARGHGPLRRHRHACIPGAHAAP